MKLLTVFEDQVWCVPIYPLGGLLCFFLFFPSFLVILKNVNGPTDTFSVSSVFTQFATFLNSLP
jgi:hypothetical protein